MLRGNEAPWIALPAAMLCFIEQEDCCRNPANIPLSNGIQLFGALYMSSPNYHAPAQPHMWHCATTDIAFQQPA
jgi:hypothetical protein